jgi:hypothetical protein
MLQYLGALRGSGTLSCGDSPMGSASYEFDGYLTRPGEITASGELRTAPGALNEIFGRRDVLLHTEDGRILSIRFSGKRLGPDSAAAHVDVGGDLPPAKQWKR